MQVLSYGTAKWDADTLGNHRVVIRVDQTNGPAVRVVIPWRRRDRNPEKIRLILVGGSSESRIANCVCRHINREEVTLIFQPLSGDTDYYLYYLPYTGTVQTPYPQIEYLEPDVAPPSDWWNTYHNLEDMAYARLPQAQAVEIQSIDELSSFYPMEVIATASEVETLLAKYPQKVFLLFPEERNYPIRMATDLPVRWIEPGPNRLFNGSAARGEFYTFQAGVYAARSELRSIQVDFSGLSHSNGQPISPPAALECFNLGGIDWKGNTFQKVISIPRGQIQPLWFGIQIPDEVIPGEYHGVISVHAEGYEAEEFPLSLQIQPELLADHGDDQPERLSRLRWLDSTIALDDEIVAPFLPITHHHFCFEILGRSIEIGEDGFPKSIRSFFTPEMTRIQETGLDILNGSVSFSVEESGRVLPWQWENKANLTLQAPGRISWETRGRAGKARLDLKASLEFDGTLEYSLMLGAEETFDLSNVCLVIPYSSHIARYMLGLGIRGGYRPPSFEWKWDVVHKNQDSIWLGEVNGGLQITLMDEHYSRPLNTNFYTLKPLVSPTSWDNHGQGGIGFSEQDGQTVLLECFSGPQTLTAGETLYFNFRLAVTPFKPIDPAAQWSTRYFHRFLPVNEIIPTGANTINVHHANEINPFINYPFLRPEAMKAYIDEAHALGMKVKIYYTVRELTNHAPELFALRSLGDEVLSDGPGGGHSWLQEHLVSNYVTGWHVYHLKDVAVVNSGTSRWHNFYLEGLDWLARNIGIDGIYIDDLAFDRVVMKRVRKILDRRRPGALIDLHSANQFRERDGYANSANLYMEHLPYLNRLWFGEYFDYNLSPDFWMVEVSGIPFGLMGEMLQDGGNQWRGMLFGMTGRLPWSGNPGAMWKAWDHFGIQNSQMIGYWSPDCPVQTNHKDVLATVYLKNGAALISIASWANEVVPVQLQFNWDALGMDPEKAILFAPFILDFQEEASFDPGQNIPIEPGKGWLFILQ